ncbi:hypothetical protein RBSWK_03802 [Rhodopirellula baltica SWK14]|uniref:Uncharacterized protein n=1 Tax=Rhodopirellula baltica SWK14 TaxID=993516 RepID=L7CDM7_RHOBT|nr:hypothetical protein RBSWK_03802 [Rhodopirellula baltica SWK14]
MANATTMIARHLGITMTANDRGGACSRSPGHSDLQRHQAKAQTQETPETRFLRTSNTT